MKFLYDIRYFFYISWHWNIRLACFCIYHEIRGEKKFDIDTVMLNNLQQLTIKGNNLRHAEVYQGANYYLLEKVFDQLQKLDANDGFLDMGCGKGRAMIVAAHYGFKSITGIDFALELCQEATRNCENITNNYPSASWKVIYADAENFTPTTDTHVIFFFNPFNEVVMNRVMTNISKSINRHPRKLFVIYINPQHKQLFTNNGFKEVYYIKKMRFVEASILQNR